MLLVVVAGLLMQLVLCPSGESEPAHASAVTVIAEHGGGTEGPIPHRDEQQPMVTPGSKLAKRIVSWQIGVLVACAVVLALLATHGPVRTPRGMSLPAVPCSGARLLTRICVCRP